MQTKNRGRDRQWWRIGAIIPQHSRDEPALRTAGIATRFEIFLSQFWEPEAKETTLVSFSLLRNATNHCVWRDITISPEIIRAVTL